MDWINTSANNVNLTRPPSLIFIPHFTLISFFQGIYSQMFF